MDQIDRMDVVREESLQSAVPKDRCNIISTDPDRKFSFSVVGYSHCKAIVHESNRFRTYCDGHIFRYRWRQIETS